MAYYDTDQLKDVLNKVKPTDLSLRTLLSAKKYHTKRFKVQISMCVTTNEMAEKCYFAYKHGHLKDEEYPALAKASVGDIPRRHWQSQRRKAG